MLKLHSSDNDEHDIPPEPPSAEPASPSNAAVPSVSPTVSPSTERSVSNRSLGNNNDLSPGIFSLSDDRLNLWQGVALLTADRLGVGVLALPNDVRVIGYGLGLAFLIANFPINYYAGDILATLALDVEGSYEADNKSNDDDPIDDLELVEDDDPNSPDIELTAVRKTHELGATKVHRRKHAGSSNSKLPEINGETTSDKTVTATSAHNRHMEDTFQDEGSIEEIMEDRDVIEHGVATIEHNLSAHKEGPAQDLTGVSNIVFESPAITKVVVCVFYLNLFLVLGDFLLVMARAVSAMFLDQICIPTAGAIASFFMFGICQLRTMAQVGRSFSLVSMVALFVVVGQCLFHHRTSGGVTPYSSAANGDLPPVPAKLSSIASIGFVVGSQKLFLNIRHELRNKEDASRVLARSLSTYGSAYVLVVILAGSNPPTFLFDAIPEGLGRRIAGFLLLGNVAVSYAINSQALCSSIDRFLIAAGGSGNSPSWFVRSKPQFRWFLLTLAVSVSSYLVSMAVPFMKDLVALIGALTSVPLSLGLPALLYRRYHHFPVLLPSRQTWGSYSLFLYSIGFLALGLAGAIVSIDEDWLTKGSPFGCRSHASN